MTRFEYLTIMSKKCSRLSLTLKGSLARFYRNASVGFSTHASLLTLEEAEQPATIVSDPEQLLGETL